MGQSFTKTAEIHGKITPGAATPVTVNGTAAPRRPPQRRPNAEARAREYLTDAEVQKLMKAAAANRNGHRDATMVLLAYRHGLRPIELVTLTLGCHRLRP
jgi:integrase